MIVAANALALVKEVVELDHCNVLSESCIDMCAMRWCPHNLCINACVCLHGVAVNSSKPVIGKLEFLSISLIMALERNIM